MFWFSPVLARLLIENDISTAQFLSDWAYRYASDKKDLLYHVEAAQLILKLWGQTLEGSLHLLDYNRCYWECLRKCNAKLQKEEIDAAKKMFELASYCILSTSSYVLVNKLVSFKSQTWEKLGGFPPAWCVPQLWAWVSFLIILVGKMKQWKQDPLPDWLDIRKETEQ
jgi:hypothetical protein